jgi:hypothetical protein
MPTSRLRGLVRAYIRTFALSALLYSFAVSCLYGQAAPAPDTKPADVQAQMASAWDQVITSTVPQAAPDPALIPPPSASTKSSDGDFLEHFYFESRSDYQRYQTNFTGNPTTAGVINAPVTSTFNPLGIPSPSAFQPGANRVEELLDFGTRGWLSDRINTHFALRYRQDLTKVDVGSPGENVVEQFYGNKLYEVLDASLEINSKPTDGWFAGGSAELGRINVYGAELASFDGARITTARRRWAFTLYGGRRFSYFADPSQRAIGGANLNLRIDPTFSVELQTLWYIRGSNKIVARKRFNDRWLFAAYLRAYGGSPVDLDESVLYTSRTGRDSFRAGFFQKLSDNDYSYDYTTAERNTAANSPLLRLYLGPINKYTQFNVEAHHQFLSNLRGGAAIVVRQLNNNNTQTPFETSFRDYRFNGQYFPWAKIETFFEYHQRSSDRLSPLGVTTLDGLTGTGETAVKDLSGEIRRSFGEGRFSLSGGVYYRRISMQDTFFYEENLHQSGVLGSAWMRVDRRTRLYFDYSLDNDFYLFTPDLKNSQVFRLGVNWKY